MLKPAVLCLLALFPIVNANLYTSLSQITKSKYDYIVVGAGTAGNVIASRLTENPHVSVLVLEAGISDEGQVPPQIPLFCPTLAPNTPYDWNYTTTPQTGYNGRTVPYPRGRMLGGSSSINFLMYMYGSSEDFDRYAAVSGDSGWKWNNVKKYIQKIEKFVGPADHHNTTGEFIPSHHSVNGSVEISLPGFPSFLDSKVVAATQELASEFPFNPDFGGGSVLGIGWVISAIGNGTRSSSSTAYLRPALHRSNLDVVINTQVTKLVQTGTSKQHVPEFRAVQASNQKVEKIFHASHEVILSAGSIGTPALLQLSGIGDPTDLKPLGIKTIVKNPSVGKNLSDHVFQPVVFSSLDNNTFDDDIRDPALLNGALTQWTANRTGLLANGVANHAGWLRIPANASIFNTVEDPAAGPNSSHFEFIISNYWVVPGVAAPPTGNFISITTNLISATSRGTVTIASKNPFDKPIVDPKFLTTDFDIFALIEGVKAAKRFAGASAFGGHIGSPFGPGNFSTAETDEELEQFIRSTAGTVWHPLGTASMSPKKASWGVVGPDLKVKGVDGLRIIDGSVLPYPPNAHTSAPIYIFAERGADLIKKDYEDCKD